MPRESPKEELPAPELINQEYGRGKGSQKKREIDRLNILSVLAQGPGKTGDIWDRMNGTGIGYSTLASRLKKLEEQGEIIGIPLSNAKKPHKLWQILPPQKWT